MNKFNVEDQYQLYLKKIRLPEKAMHPIQKVQLKDTFMAAWGQLLILQKDEVSQLKDNDAVDSLESMFQQINNYWRDKVLAQKN